MPRKRRDAFLDAATEIIERYRDLAEVPRIRPTQQDAEIAEAVHEVSTWLRAMMPTLRGIG